MSWCLGAAVEGDACIFDEEVMGRGSFGAGEEGGGPGRSVKAVQGTLSN